MADSKFSFRAIYAIAKKEFMDNVRNKWIIALVIIFILLTLLSSYLAASQKIDYIKPGDLISGEGIGSGEWPTPPQEFDIPGMKPGDTIRIKDDVAYIVYQYNPMFNLNLTYVWFESLHLNETVSDWYNASSGQYNQSDFMIEGDQTADYGINSTMIITLHIIEVDSAVLKGEWVKELWDSDNNLPKPYLSASALVKEGDGDGALGDMEETVVTLISISSILIPIIAIMLGYATISGESESGALNVVLAYPVRRVEVLLGKFLGLGFVLVVATVAGFGLGGIIISTVAGAESIGGFLAFIGLTILLGLLFLSMAILFSSITKRRSTSIAAGVLLFFWGMIIGMIIFGIYYATGGSFEELFTGTGQFPDWLWAMMFLSPMDMTQMATMQAFGLSNVMGYNLVAPGFVSVGSIVLVQVIWIVIALVLAYFFFSRRDI
jgi:Cu-processing system permease protein